MAPLRWITGLALAGALASCSPSAPRSADIAGQFVSDLISNVTKAETELKARNLLTCAQDESLVVNVGYAKYRGYHNATTGLNYWKGMRYAAAPTGNLRWQPPHALPLDLNAPITDATTLGPSCPQSLPSVPNGFPIPGSEDCLYLNVYAPANAKKLPVMVWIHPGGYGLGDGFQDMTDIINANEKGFVAVTFQYRLGAFGWLSSSEVKNKGVVNAGMLDQAAALAWVKLFICQFGGDPSAITIAGESAGGGSVAYHGLAVNGNLGTLLFKQGIASSPYLPFQYKYDDALPTSRYYAFSVAAGCPASGDVFDCLVGKDTDTLQQASFLVTQASPYGYWGFWPVTDNVYINQLPSQGLTTKRVNGKRLLVGHQANEGGLFVPGGITTEADLVNWLQNSEFPNMTPDQINQILAANPNSAPTDPSAPKFETNGLGGPGATAVFVSQDANGQQQRGNNIYAESTFACPAYWMASAYTSSKKNTEAFLYQFSVPFAFHGADLAAFLGPQTPNLNNDFVAAARRIWGNFIRTGNPSISAALANGAGSTSPHPATNWPKWSENQPKLMVLNITGGVPYDAPTAWGTTVKQFAEPGLKNAIRLASADSWEGGRRARCNVYMDLSASIPL